MRVAYVLMQFPAPSETFASNDVRALVARGDDVTVFSMRTRHADHAALLADRGLARLDVRPMSVARALRALARAIAQPARSLALLGWTLRAGGRRPRHLLASLALFPAAIAIAVDVEDEGFDVLHLFWGHYPSMIVAGLRHRAPLMVRSMFLGAYDLLMAYRGSADAAREADVVWTHARVNVPDLERLGVPTDQLRVGYRGVDVERLDAVLDRAALDRVPYRVVTVARLVASKRIDDVIRAFAQVRRAVPEATLTIVGDGPERAALEALARDTGAGAAIEFLGHVPHDEALRVVARAQVFVLLSTKPDERLPNAAKEAMALGCVCVVTPTPGIEELVEDGHTGFVVDGRDDTAVVASIMRALGDGPDLDRLRAAARAHVRASFDVAATMDAYRGAWAAALEARRAMQRPATPEPDGPPRTSRG